MCPRVFALNPIITNYAYMRQIIADAKCQWHMYHVSMMKVCTFAAFSAATKGQQLWVVRSKFGSHLAILWPVLVSSKCTREVQSSTKLYRLKLHKAAQLLARQTDNCRGDSYHTVFSGTYQLAVCVNIPIAILPSFLAKSEFKRLYLCHFSHLKRRLTHVGQVR